MNHSLNEIESMSKLAARGAGYSWGLAEEAAKAARWLSYNDLDGCRALANVLKQFDGSELSDRTPQVGIDTWTGKHERQCPIIAGALLSDSANLLDGRDIRIIGLIQPNMLLFFASLAAKRRGGSVSLTWPGAFAITDGQGTVITDTDSISTNQDGVLVQFANEKVATNELQTRAEPEPEAWKALTIFAARTYAPATEQSRLTGAGAGLSDND